MVLNSPCFTVKSWLVQDQTVPVQKQTVFGKDKSNPLIVDSLLKTIRFSIHLVLYNGELAIPEQTGTGKGTSNLLMAVSVELSILATTLNRLERSIFSLESTKPMLLVLKGSNIEPLVSSRFTWVFFLTTKDETSEILKNFIKEIENLVDKKVKIIRCNNGTEFKNQVMNEFCRDKGIRREYSVARTPQQNAEVVSTACYVQNRVLIVKPHNKTPYELFRGKFDGKSDEGFFVGYSLSSKAFRVYNTRTKKVEENLHVGFLENKPMLDGNGPKWLFDIDSLTQTMNYVPVAADTLSNESTDASYFDSPSKIISNDEPSNESHENDESEDASSPKEVNTDEQQVNTASPEVNTVVSPVNTAHPKDMLAAIPTTPNTRIHKDHPLENVIGNVQSSIQIREMKESTSEQGFFSAVYEEKTHEDLHTCLFACFLSQEEPKRIIVDLPKGKRPIGLKWIFKNKTDERGIVIRNKARLVAQGHTQEEGIDFDDVFSPVARIEAIRLFLAYASFMGFIVYQMYVKSAFLYGTIIEEVYVCQPPGFEDPDYPDKVYKMVKALYGLHQAPRAWYETLAKYLLDNGFHRGRIDPTLFIKKQKGDILLVQVYVDDILFGSTKTELCTDFEKLMKDNQDKYVAEILRKFNYTDVKTTSTLFDLEKPLVKDGDADDVDVHLYRSMIGSLMYLIISRPDIMFVVYACARFQVTPKTSHLLVVKRIFRYLKGKPTLGLWYSRDSPFELVAYTDSDYAGATQDRKSTTGGCQFLGNRLISWQCKK
ncbi:hypothetical protein Tco_0626554 [Tanacetum coccineum]|uniref:Reverse transcriptase Ty1/copia-type domain-containing protein n=1 Tax=Tanacetum coccineum TaxID=301880 RepID=A0ABQ4WJV5_9ASTR